MSSAPRKSRTRNGRPPPLLLLVRSACRPSKNDMEGVYAAHGAGRPTLELPLRDQLARGAFRQHL